MASEKWTKQSIAKAVAADTALRRVWSRFKGVEYEASLQGARGGTVYKCGKCRKGVLGTEPGGLYRNHCLVCGSDACVGLFEVEYRLR